MAAAIRSSMARRDASRSSPGPARPFWPWPAAGGATSRRPPGAPAGRPGAPVPPRAPRSTAGAPPAPPPRHGGGHPVVYGTAGRQRILAEVDRPPTQEADGTATWSLGTLRTALRSTPGGLPAVSTYTLWRVLHGAGYSHQQTRTWCPTGTALRRRKAGVAVVTDPDAESKKS